MEGRCTNNALIGDVVHGLTDTVDSAVKGLLVGDFDGEALGLKDDSTDGSVIDTVGIGVVRVLETEVLKELMTAYRQSLKWQ